MPKIALVIACAVGSITVAGCTNVSPDRNASLSVAPGVAPRYNERHYRWCAQQYTTYRRSSNTYSLGGNSITRRRCVSPYI